MSGIGAGAFGGPAWRGTLLANASGGCFGRGGCALLEVLGAGCAGWALMGARSACSQSDADAPLLCEDDDAGHEEEDGNDAEPEEAGNDEVACNADSAFLNS